MVSNVGSYSQYASYDYYNARTEASRNRKVNNEDTSAAGQNVPNSGNPIAELLAQIMGSISGYSGSQISSDSQSTLLGAQEAQSTDIGGPPDPAQMFTKLDVNGDGSLSEDEFAAGAPDGDTTKASKLFAKIDTDGDGQISEAENQAFADKMRAGHPHGHHQGGKPDGVSEESDDGSTTSAVKKAIDTNGDGQISASEMKAFMASLAQIFNEQDSTSASNTQNATKTYSSVSTLLETAA